MFEKLISDDLFMSVEVFPPKKDGHIEEVIRPLKEINLLKPDFVSITYGANGKGSDKTVDAASVAIDAFDLDVLAHLTCVNMTKERIDEFIETYKRKNIKNVLCLRGDITDDSKFYDFNHANELAYYIKKNHPEFTVFGACYPEGHPESKNKQEDIDVVKKKIDCGIEYFISQLFLDNSAFYAMRDSFAKNGIKAPLLAGIMPITQATQLARIENMCGAKAPKRFVDEVVNCGNVYDAGIEYAISQITDLIQNGVTNIHIYTMNKADIVKKIFGVFSVLR